MDWLRGMWQRLFGPRTSFDSEAVQRAFVDRLTGLPTRHALLERFRAARAAGVKGVVLMADVDHFKGVNDRFGHGQGDVFLRLVADRMRSALPSDAVIGRLGGDEFVALLPGMAMPVAQGVVRSMLDRIREPMELDGDRLTATMSAGLTEFPGQSIDELFRACDIAMYAAKARGRDRVVVFDEETRSIATKRRELASAVIELQERNRALYDEARTDALTGLRNRKALDEVLEIVVGSGSPWTDAAVAFIDIDHFGAVNKLYGDPGGDRALRAVADEIRRLTREEDLVFRKGGEELVVILPGVTGEQARAAAERIRAGVEALAIPHAGSSVAPVVTVTVGLATGGRGQQVAQLVNVASEQAMRAKVQSQRNRVHWIRLGT